ncbi:hypothetical protein PHMEG_0009588 [Phytophthora megakarya]|uniref:Uncharacterized protein n=1 Tax=Phytophthora megakarya TaxID=4795 RepID=A0A225WGS1_9STRA|nr:hypothetical protein PHMEG_0009588 [Phytophthora megakarya]
MEVTYANGKRMIFYRLSALSHSQPAFLEKEHEVLVLTGKLIASSPKKNLRKRLYLKAGSLAPVKNASFIIVENSE